jgi:hypothetical protein
MVKRALILLLVAAGCSPELGVAPSLVTSARVVAVKLEPPEAAPGAAVTATAFVVSPDGVVTPSVDWSLCLTPKATTVNDVVDPACAAAGGTMAVAATAAPVAVTLPGNACRLFGPDTPPQMPGQPPVQSRAPDVTGGYYQPIRLDLAGASTFALARIRCALAGASFDVAAAYAATYVANRNPTVTPLSVTADGVTLALDAIPAGRAVTLAVGWPDDARESFPVLDPVAQALVTTRETMTVSWYATAGTIAAANTTGDSFATTTWTTPAAGGAAHLYVVLRDSRGGADVAAYDVVVK